MKFYGFFAFALVTMGNAAYAADSFFDGKRAMLCTVHQLHECDSHSGCSLVAHDVAEDIRRLRFDFKKKDVRLEHLDTNLSNSIDQVKVVDEILIVQGTDAGRQTNADGGGWSVSVNRKYGTMILTVSGAEVGFVGLGACVPN